MLEQAIARGIDGWVRNRRDGSVEAVIAADQAVVRDLIAWCWVGPPRSRVDEIKETVVDGKIVEKGFRQAPSR